MKEQSVASETSIPDPLNIFAKKLGEGHSTYIEKRKITANELLRKLAPVHKPAGCLSVIPSLEKCNEMNDGIKKNFKSLTQNDYKRRFNGTLRKVFSNIKELEDEEEESGSKCSISITDDLQLSLDDKWLIKYLKWPLKQAMKEILLRKPSDPVGFLGYWLLNYKKCQEKSILQLEEDEELNYYRYMIDKPMFKVVEVAEVSGADEEEEIRDQNFKYYGAPHLSV